MEDKNFPGDLIITGKKHLVSNVQNYLFEVLDGKSFEALAEPYFNVILGQKELTIMCNTFSFDGTRILKGLVYSNHKTLGVIELYYFDTLIDFDGFKRSFSHLVADTVASYNRMVK